MVFIYESRVLTPARPNLSNSIFTEDSDTDSSFVISVSKSQKIGAAGERQPSSSSNDFQIVSEGADHSVLFVPQKVDVVNLVSQNSTQTTKPSQKTSWISVADSDDDDDVPKRRAKKKKNSGRPVVILKRLPGEVLGTSGEPINIASNESLREFMGHEKELSFEHAVEIENLALHGETSTAQRFQRLSLKKKFAPRRLRRNKREAAVNGDEAELPERKRKTYCAFCEKWIVDLKYHRKQHNTLVFRCEICGKEYGMKTHLAQHVRKWHSDVIV